MPLGFGSLLGFYSAIRAIERYGPESGFARQVVAGCLEALEDGNVAIKRIVSTRVIEIEAPEDENPGYLFDLGEGRILVLTGSHANDVDADVAWPNSDFELERTVGGNLWLGIHCRGAELSPIRVIPASECGVEFTMDEREEVIRADLDEYADSLIPVDP
jgi:hypothetical protein